MSRPSTLSRTQIVSCALDLVRREGEQALSARNVARELNCSTQPIFSHFAGMKELRTAVLEEAFALYAAYLEEDISGGRYPAYKASGMAYIRFAREQKELFRMLYMSPRENLAGEDDRSWEAIVEILMQKSGLSHEDGVLFHAEMWVFVHGIAAMIATSYRDWPEDTVSAMLSDQYYGLAARYGGETVVRDPNP